MKQEETRTESASDCRKSTERDYIVTGLKIKNLTIYTKKFDYNAEVKVKLSDIMVRVENFN